MVNTFTTTASLETLAHFPSLSSKKSSNSIEKACLLQTSALRSKQQRPDGEKQGPSQFAESHTVAVTLATLRPLLQHICSLISPEDPQANINIRFKHLLRLEIWEYPGTCTYNLWLNFVLIRKCFEMLHTPETHHPDFLNVNLLAADFQGRTEDKTDQTVYKCFIFTFYFYRWTRTPPKEVVITWRWKLTGEKN